MYQNTIYIQIFFDDLTKGFTDSVKRKGSPYRLSRPTKLLKVVNHNKYKNNNR